VLFGIFSTAVKGQIVFGATSLPLRCQGGGEV